MQNCDKNPGGGVPPHARQIWGPEFLPPSRLGSPPSSQRGRRVAQLLVPQAQRQVPQLLHAQLQQHAPLLALVGRHVAHLRASAAITASSERCAPLAAACKACASHDDNRTLDCELYLRYTLPWTAAALATPGTCGGAPRSIARCPRKQGSQPWVCSTAHGPPACGNEAGGQLATTRQQTQAVPQGGRGDIWPPHPGLWLAVGQPQRLAVVAHGPGAHPHVTGHEANHHQRRRRRRGVLLSQGLRPGGFAWLLLRCGGRCAGGSRCHPPRRRPRVAVNELRHTRRRHTVCDCWRRAAWRQNAHGRYPSGGDSSSIMHDAASCAPGWRP